MKRLMYHTQEKRRFRLSGPAICSRNDAWLGSGYYFWDEETDAVSWGYNSKKRTGAFEIYKANIETENFLNTVFNEEHYNFYRSQIDKVGERIWKKTGIKATVEDVCEYINEKAKWTEELDGIIFQDLPTGDSILINKYPYRKRIQAVVYKLSCITDFIFKDEYNAN
ncbi:hypothetical protein FH717_06225 [Bacteroides thetaiotaomicron]|uniref:hypothetical protein n=1 Tax=Bacteroides ovatus TaxID=28116 RepID=UPI0032608ABB|nr:hypothetical protein [Bacteroides thetaiotaomicron]